MSNARVSLGFKRKIMVIRRYILPVLLAAFLAFPVDAWAGDALVNSDASVDITGKDAADAKAQAVAKGQYDALVGLLNKLSTPEQAQEIMNSMDSSKVAAIVRSMEVLDERISSNRYRARFVVSFDGNEISKLIGKGHSDEGAQQQAASAFVIIPAFEEAGDNQLWEDDNPWRNAWKSVAIEIPAGDIIVPYGDNSDMSILTVQNLPNVNYSALIPLTVRYGASDIVILQAKFSATPDMVVNVVKRRINRLQNEVTMQTYRADPQETKSMLLTRAARDIAANIQKKKVEEQETIKAIQGGNRNKVMVLASVSTLSSWTQIRAKLSTLPMIDQIEVLAVAPQQVDVAITYRGSAESLANGITAQNLRLIQNQDYWVVSRD